MPSKAELKEKIEAMILTLWRSFSDIVPENLQRIDELTQALLRALEQRLSFEDMHLKGLFERLQGLNPLAILKRGYSVTSLAETGEVILSAGDVLPGSLIKTKLSQGELISRVIQKKSPGF